MRRLFGWLSRLVDTSFTPPQAKRRKTRAGARSAFRPRLEGLEDRLAPASLSWDGQGGDGLWHNPLNWNSMNNDVVPGPGDDTSISMGYSVVANADVSVASLSSSSPITFNGNVTLGGGMMTSSISANATFNGELTLGDNLMLGDMMSGGGGAFNGDVHIAAGKQLQLTAGAFTFGAGVDVDGDGLVKVMGTGVTANIGSNAVSFRNLELSNSMAKLLGSGGTVTIENLLNLQGGRIEGSGTLIVQSGELKIAGMMDTVIQGWSVENYAATNWTNGNLTTTGTTFTNKTGSTFNLGEWAGNWTATGGQFVNQGTFNSSGPPMQGHTMGIEFVSTQQAEVLSGNLTLTQGREFGGRVTIQGNSSLTLAAGTFRFNNDLDITGTGTLLHEGGIVDVLGIARCSPVYELRGGTLQGGGTFYITNRMTWIEGEMRGTGITRIDTGAQLVTNLALVLNQANPPVVGEAAN